MVSMSIPQLWRMMMRLNGSLRKLRLVMDYLILSNVIYHLLFECLYLPFAVSLQVCRKPNDVRHILTRTRVQGASRRNWNHLGWVRICVMFLKKSFQWKKNSLSIQVMKLPHTVINPIRKINLYSRQSLIDPQEHLHPVWTPIGDHSHQVLQQGVIVNPCRWRIPQKYKQDQYLTTPLHSYMVIPPRFPSHIPPFTSLLLPPRPRLRLDQLPHLK